MLPDYPVYVTQTNCGAMRGQGLAAHTVLADELDMLGGIIGLVLKRQSEVDATPKKTA